MIHWATDVGDRWEEVLAELRRGFVTAQTAAKADESFVYVVNLDDLLGRRGPGRAMVATGLLSAARTAALEGARRGWTANVIAYQGDGDRTTVEAWAAHLIEAGDVTGELIRLGVGHLGKALP